LLLTAVLLRRRRFSWALAVQQSIDIFCLPGPQQQTRRTPLQRSTTGTIYRYSERISFYFLVLLIFAF